MLLDDTASVCAVVFASVCQYEHAHAVITFRYILSFSFENVFTVSTIGSLRVHLIQHQYTPIRQLAM